MNKKLEIIQEERSDCGICSLASIIKYYGGDISLEVLRYYTNTGVNGTNAYELIECAKRFGFNAYGEKCKDVDNLNQPVIAHLKLENDFYHFVVIYKIKDDFIFIMDPSIGFRKMKLNEFYKIYTGIIIHFNPINAIPKYKKSKFLFKKIVEEMRINKKSYFLLLIISLVALLFTLINNFEIKILSLNNKYIYLLILMIILNELLIYFKNIVLLNNSIKFNNNVIKDFIIHIFKLPLYYLKLKQKGEITSRFNELNDLTNNILIFFIEILFCFILCLLSIFMIIYISFKIFLILIIVSIIYIIFNLKINKSLVNEIKYSINLEEDYNSKILDYISNFDTIKHLNIYDYFINNIDINLINRNKIIKTLRKKVFRINLFNNIIFGIVLLFILSILINNSYSLTNSMVIYVIITFYINNLKSLVSSYPSLLIYKSYLNKSNEFLSFNEYNLGKEIFNFKNINIKNLYYKINNNIIFKNFNYNIKSKDKIFINGPSGIGKSTLMKILNNEINRYSGNVLIDGLNIKNYNIKDFITYVSQNETLFNDTIINNITLGKDIAKGKLEEVLKITRLNSISIIDSVGLDAFIINNNSLSGGERNRLILARSLIHSKEIIILDEVLKEVDESLEIEIVKDILEIYKDKTILYISHKNIGYLFDKVLTFRKEK